MLAVIAALVAAGPWMGHQIAGFAERTFSMLN
jgi:type III secretory pathway component EscS